MVVKEGARNHELNHPGGKEGEGRNQQRQPDEHGGNPRGGHHQRAGEYGRNRQHGDYGKNHRADVHLNPGRGGNPNPNPRFGNIGGGYKRGVEERDGQGDHREVDPRLKVRREVDAGGVGHGGPSHCFNCNRDGHFQASCTNPPFCYNCRKDGHRAMSCPVKKGFNLRICAYGMPGQAFYSISVPDEEGDKLPETFPGLLTIKEGVAAEGVIDLELKHVFKGMYGWTIKKIDEDSFLLNFPTAELRDQLTKFKGFEFATAYIKAKVELTKMEKEAVCILEETWVNAIGFPRKARKAEVIKEIAHMIRDPIEVDGNLLRSEGKVRVKVLFKDAMKIDGSTLLYINGQGHLLKWSSEKLEEYKKQHPQEIKDSISDKDEDDLEEEGDNGEESSANHDSGFARLGREQAEEEKRRNLGRASGKPQNDDIEAMDFEGFQFGAEVGQESQKSKKKFFDEEMVDDDVALEREKEEMKKIDERFDEKTQRLTQMIGIQQSGYKLSMPGEEKSNKFVMVEKNRALE
jgi:hypothetical protein